MSAEYQKQYYQQNKQKIKARAKDHYADNRDEAIARANKWQQENKEAHAAAIAKYAAANKEVGASANKRYREKHAHTLAYVQRSVANRSRSRAKKKGWDHDIDAAYVKEIWPTDNRCPVFGTEFTFGSEEPGTVASIDRIDSSKGYVKGNVVIVSWRVNDLKSDATLSELESVVRFYQNLS